VLELRAFPDPGRDATSAEVKADIERKLGPKANDAQALIPAVIELAGEALKRGDMAMAGQLAGDFGQTLLANSMADFNDADRREAIAEVRRAMIDAAASSGKLTDTQRTAIGQLQRMDDLNDAVTASVFMANTRFEDAFKRLPWDKETTEQARAQNDPERNPFARVI
jgi:hypothetical protein